MSRRSATQAKVASTICNGVLVTFLGAGTALADAIDGDWCYSTQTLTIQGPRIRTPGGTDMTGDYTRHTFNYVVPASEPGAGTAIAMQILSEETMTLVRGDRSKPDNEVWKRCKPVS